jgi:hypothetical protein
MDEVKRKLRRVQLRMGLQIAAQHFAKSALFVATAVAAYSAVLLVINRPPLQPTAIAITIAFAGVIAALLAWWKTPRLSRTATLVDHYGATRDRFTTTLVFAGSAVHTPIQQLALDECRAFIRRFDERSLTRFNWPRAANYILIPLTTIAFIFLHRHLMLTDDQPQGASAEAIEKAEQLEILAQQTRSVEPKSSELERLSQEMRDSAKRLRSADATQKTALRELSALEAMIQQMKQQRSGASAEELAALTAGLNDVDVTQDAADALKSGNMEKAAEQLRNTAQKLTQEELAKKIAAAMRARLSNLKEKTQGEITKQMSAMANAAQSPQAMREALQRLAQTLQQMSGSSARGPSAPDKNNEALQKLLAALQNMKYGAKQQAAPLPSTELGTLMQNFDRGGGKSIDGSIPTGQPGTEDDSGTTESPFGPMQNPPEPAQMIDHAPGVLAEGESLQDLITAGADDSKATQRYRELYNAAKPAAEEAVLREDIPLGSRFLIKRYFESIRPQE